MSWFRRFSSVVFTAALVAAASNAKSQEVEIDLVGVVGWDQFKNRLNIRAERIESNIDETSGSLILGIWATPEVYDGVDLAGGFPIGWINLRPLPPQTSYANTDRFVRYRRPPAGLYHTTMTIEEFLGDGYYVQDYVNFEGLVNLGGFGEGTVFAPGDNMDVHFLDEVSWLAGDGRVNLFAERIQNDRGTKTRAMRIRLWATTTPYDGDVLQGYPLAKKGIGRLRDGFEFVNVSRRARFRPPPPGTYYITMTLEEYNRGWFILDYLNFPGTSLF